MAITALWEPATGGVKRNTVTPQPGFGRLAGVWLQVPFFLCFCSIVFRCLVACVQPWNDIRVTHFILMQGLEKQLKSWRPKP